MTRPVVFHIPHCSQVIPRETRGQFALPDDALHDEITRMTDWYTDELFREAATDCTMIIHPVSRLVVDPERFRRDAEEPMASRGMGAIYTRTHDGAVLRQTPTAATRSELLARWYDPHHARLARAVDDALKTHGRALIIDCHSFPKKPLPYEIDQTPNRPEICIGTDPHHTPASLLDAATNAFEARGFSVGIDRPFSGSIVPVQHYQQDLRVNTVMVEVRRDLYIDEATAVKRADFQATVPKLTACLRDFCAMWMTRT